GRDDCRNRREAASLTPPEKYCISSSSEGTQGNGEIIPGARAVSLFSNPSPAPEGLRYQPDFISERDERELVARIRSLPLEPFQFGAFEGKRRVASFGWRYDYGQQKLVKAKDLPAWIAPVIARVEAWQGLAVTAIRQMLFTEYDVGAEIGWHRDKPHFDQVFGLSLLSACKFRFRRKTEGGWERYTLQAEPRSLYLMSGESRHVWEHSIPPVEMVRYSVTFRTMAVR
ncbi:MAG: alpha-ketoglutarate-dependent dioxygenase AlkB, partial [Xanthobacteraceae bacterium]